MPTYYEMVLEEKTGVLTFKPVTWPGEGPAIHQLDIPWRSQLGPDAAYSNSDCGPASLSMLLVSRGKTATVDQVSIATGQPRGYTYTLPGDLMRASVSFGVQLQRRTDVTIDVLRQEIDQGRPVVTLVHYPTLVKRYDLKFAKGHWVLVVGHVSGGDGGEIIYHDPYWPDTTGRYLRLGSVFFAKAMQDCTIDGNTPNQGLFIKS